MENNGQNVNGKDIKKKSAIPAVLIGCAVIIFFGIFAVLAVVTYLYFDRDGDIFGTNRIPPTPIPPTPIADVSLQPIPTDAPTTISSPENGPSTDFKRVFITDPHLKLDFATIIVPSGWTYNSEFSWNLANPMCPEKVDVKIWNSKGFELIELHTGGAYIQFSGARQRVHVNGSNYMGATVRPYMTAEQALSNIVLPQYRPSSQIISTSPAQNASYNQTLATASLKTYLNGEQISEMVIVRVDKNVSGDSVLWKISSIMIFGAKEDFDAELGAAVKTLAFNEAWVKVKDQITDEIARKNINSINQLAENTRQIVRERTGAVSEAHRKWEQTYLGVSDYTDPHTGKKVELGFYKKYTWINSSGKVYQTDDPNADPNTFTNDLTWRRSSTAN